MPFDVVRIRAALRSRNVASVQENHSEINALLRKLA